MENPDKLNLTIQDPEEMEAAESKAILAKQLKALAGEIRQAENMIEIADVIESTEDAQLLRRFNEIRAQQLEAIGGSFLNTFDTSDIEVDVEVEGGVEKKTVKKLKLDDEGFLLKNGARDRHVSTVDIPVVDATEQVNGETFLSQMKDILLEIAEHEKTE